MQCPNCGEKATIRTWKDDIHGSMVTVETSINCRSCGYREGNAYGESYSSLEDDDEMKSESEDESEDD